MENIRLLAVFYHILALKDSRSLDPKVMEKWDNRRE